VPLLTVLNKVDLSGEAPGAEGGRIRLSAKTGAGMDGLRAALLEVAGWTASTSGETVFLARERHLQALARAQGHLAAAAAYADAEHGYGNAQLELFAEELRLAGSRLSEITGEVTADDLLGGSFPGSASASKRPAHKAGLVRRHSSAAFGAETYMSSHASTPRLTLNDLRRLAATRKLAMLTCYDAAFAATLDGAGVDILLIGDSLGMVVQGHDSTLPVTVADVAYHTACVARGAARPWIVADMPFGSFQASPEQAFAGAVTLMQAGSQMVKIEGGAEMAPTVEFMVRRGVPVCAHVGLTPQHVNVFGGYRVQGRGAGAAEALLASARALQDAGAAMMVIEAVPEPLARRVAEELALITIASARVSPAAARCSCCTTCSAPASASGRASSGTSCKAQVRWRRQWALTSTTCGQVGSRGPSTSMPKRPAADPGMPGDVSGLRRRGAGLL